MTVCVFDSKHKAWEKEIHKASKVKHHNFGLSTKVHIAHINDTVRVICSLRNQKGMMPPCKGSVITSTSLLWPTQAWFVSNMSSFNMLTHMLTLNRIVYVQIFCNCSARHFSSIFTNNLPTCLLWLKTSFQHD